MNIIIVGAGKVGLALTQQLSTENRVTVIDENQQIIENIINHTAYVFKNISALNIILVELSRICYVEIIAS